jgi:hypothetical protein
MRIEPILIKFYTNEETKLDSFQLIYNLNKMNL